MSYVARGPREGTGWLVFASIAMIVAGINRVIDAFWVFDKDDELTGATQMLLFDDNLLAYGWAWLIMASFS